MYIDFSAVRDGRSTQVFRLERDGPALEGFFADLVGPLEVAARIRQPSGRTFTADVRVRGEIQVPCSRCLNPARQQLDDRFQLLFEVRDPGQPAPAEEDEDILSLRSPFDRVDIGPRVREALFLSAERFLLCRDDCRGICPACGEDLNLADCGCQPAVNETRWEKLRELRS